MLTPKQAKFARQYVIDFNATQAAIRAGYSPHAATAEGSRLLTNVNVRPEVERLIALQKKKSGITQDQVIEILIREANGEGPDTTSAARIRATELLGKHLGMLVEKSEVEFRGLSISEITERVRVYRETKIIE